MIDERFALTVTRDVDAPDAGAHHAGVHDAGARDAGAPRSRLRESLLRLDHAARARLVTTGDDVESAVALAGARLEARATAALRQALHSRAWLLLGLALGLGVLLGRKQR